MDVAVLETLEQAGSQDPNIFKPAEQTLKQWETQQGFYTTLFNVFSNHSFSINVRWTAILYFKNGVDRYWRKNAPNEISAAEKEFIRQGLLSRFDEPVNQLAIQLAVVIAKIARFDCPKEWGTLVPTVLEGIKSDRPLMQHRSLLIFHHVVKVFASKILEPDRRNMQELTANVFDFILNIWNSHTESYIILISNESSIEQIEESIKKAFLSLKILKTLVISGIKKPSEHENVMMFLKVIFERAKIGVECRKRLEAKGIQKEVLDKFIIHLTKVLLQVIKCHPFCYVELIPASLEFTIFYCFTDEGQSLSFERFTIQCLNLLKQILHSIDYRPLTYGLLKPENHQQCRDKVNQVKEILTNYFNPEILTEICTRLVTQYFLLTPADLELWDSDPENFGVDDSGESWKFSLRPCTESVFLVILHQFKDILANVLVELMKKHHQLLVDPNDLHLILLKDAVYNAAGLAGFDLYDEVNFDQWFSTTLKEELKVRSNNYRVIRRRVYWLIGRWSGIKLSPELRPDLYNLMVQALNPGEDLGVRLAASDALKLVIDDFQFNTVDFAPFLETAFSLLFSLLKEVNECETKMRVLNVISFMIERVGSEVKPHVVALNAYLPYLWQQSENHNMLRCAIVSTLVQLEKALGSDGVILQPLVVAVIELSCDRNQEEHVYLLEDGLELWLALLENTPSPTPVIMDLFRYMPSLLESSSENLRLCLYIIQAYVLFNPQEFLSEKGPVIVDTLKSILGDLRSEGIIMIMRLLELCVKAAPESGTQFIKPLLLRMFESVYNGDEYPMVLTMYLCIVSRVLLYSRDVFIQIIRELAKEMGQEMKQDVILAQMIRTYVDHMPLVVQHKKSKLLALALCFLIDANWPPSVLQYFPRIIANIVETLNDIMISKVNEMDIMSGPVDSLIIESDQNLSCLEDIGYETEHSQRKRKLVFTDPVHCIVLNELLQNQLNTLRRVIGNEQFEQMMQSISSEVDQQLREYVTI